ncbi:Glutamine amidotransferase class-I [Actinokineospora alba]|uniref:CTP synthase (glutamine hydrolyzing) n=1 Tax=Actinokineospora alba TaxID=504798 RepID=A0A1H0EMF2_9PSEU|nr:hypothetical protein [Actinokineospora alba]TDP69137.1 glutamine amidotransferase class I [Actinokineospora alba]SDI23510.1 Glutamine amidotransferase class-I [Actinokineospora alba]SDN83531.1 Glutamine amidotransferase class-I [Actinokineospora alba]
MAATSTTTRLALVGDRSPAVRAHVRLPGLIGALAEHDGLVVDAYWIPTEDAAHAGALDGFDAIWLVPGSPYQDEAGAIAAVRAAREGGIPFLGTCGGFQLAMLEFARTVCGLVDAEHAEEHPEAEQAVIVPLACSLVGHDSVVQVERGSLAERALGARRTIERYFCSYGLDPAYVDTLRAAGLRFSGADETGDVRIAELPGHPFFLATLFQPELADGPRAHPVVRAFATAAVDRLGGR